MARDITQSFREEITSPQSSICLLELLSIDSEDLSSPLYFVRNTSSIVSNGNTYVPANFSANIPSQEESMVGDTSITVSGINRQVIEAVRGISDSPDVTLSYVLDTDLDTVVLGPYEFKLRNVSYNVNSVSGTLKHEYVLRKNISRLKITNRDFPALFLR